MKYLVKIIAVSLSILLPTTILAQKYEESIHPHSYNALRGAQRVPAKTYHQMITHLESSIPAINTPIPHVNVSTMQSHQIMHE
jgi:hypothetical protein